MKRKLLLFPLLFSPMLASCTPNIPKIDFCAGSYVNEIQDIDVNVLAAKMYSSQDSFFLISHVGESCSCYNEFKYVLKTYNENRKNEGKEYIPFYSFDQENINSYEYEGLKIDRIVSGYVDFYVILNGEVQAKYSKGAKIDYEIFESVEKFSKIANNHIKTEPIKNYSIVSYNYLTNNLINHSNNEFALVTIRSGCSDCSYAIPNVVEPWVKENELKIPLLIVDIEKFRSDSTTYDEVKSALNMTESASKELGYGTGYVPTYQYWKDGVLLDAGVYGNDSFDLDNDQNKIIVTSTFFDGTRNIDYSSANLINEYSLDIQDLYYDYEYDGSDEPICHVYVPIEKMAEYHDPIISSFLTYYCKK